MRIFLIVYKLWAQKIQEWLLRCINFAILQKKIPSLSDPTTLIFIGSKGLWSNRWDECFKNFYTPYFIVANQQSHFIFFQLRLLLHSLFIFSLCADWLYFPSSCVRFSVVLVFKLLSVSLSLSLLSSAFLLWADKCGSIVASFLYYFHLFLYQITFQRFKFFFLFFFFFYQTVNTSITTSLLN